jgi:hypothetical protein
VSSYPRFVQEYWCADEITVLQVYTNYCAGTGDTVDHLPGLSCIVQVESRSLRYGKSIRVLGNILMPGYVKVRTGLVVIENQKPVFSRLMKKKKPAGTVQ